MGGWATARVRIIAAVISILVVASFATTGVPRRAARAGPRPPNIIVIVTDDQRFETNAGDRPVIPQIQQLIGDTGLTFDQAIVSNPLCCPSRASLLLGAYSHTTGVYTNTYRENEPYGAWSAFVATGDEQVTIARALHRAGYRTALFGKYFNNFAGTQAPAGWDRFATFLHEGDGGAYYDYDLRVDGPAGSLKVRHGHLPTDYSTFVFQQMALDFLREVPTDQPFLLYLTPYAPHGNITPGPHDVGTWSDLEHPRMRANFNEGVLRDKPGYIREHGELPRERAVRLIQRTNETLASVDRMVAKVVTVLRDRGLIGRTAIFYLSDNGISFGEHTLDYKLNPHEESIRVPFMVRYDPLTRSLASHETHALVANIDVVPTIAELAGISYEGTGTVDGTSLVPLLNGSGTSVRREVLLEHLDYPSHHRVPTYCGMRTPRWMYVRYRTGEQELYDIANDPYQLANAVKALPDVARMLRERTKELCVPVPPGYTWG